MIGKTATEQSCRFHINCHCTSSFQILFKGVIMLPNTAVGCIDCSCPIIASIVTDSRWYGTLQHKCRQGRNLRRDIVVWGTFTADSGNWQNQVTYFIFFIDSSTFSQKQAGLWRDGTQQIHNYGGIGTSHAKVDDCDSFCTGRDHIGVFTQNGNIKFLCKYFYILVEVSQQDILSKVFQVTFGVTG